MRNAQKPDHTSLGTLLGWLREGRYVVPDFQREFEWDSGNIRDLVRSIFLDYYIGSLLLWKGTSDNFKALSCEAIYGHSTPNRPEYIVLDGQQRLTAMYYAFVAPNKPLPNRTNRFLYSVRIDRFMAEQYDDAFSYDWGVNRINRLIAGGDSLYAEHIFPCAIIGAGGWELPNWVQGYERYWREQCAEAAQDGDQDTEKAASRHAENAREFGNHMAAITMAAITQQYQISYIELDQDLAIDKVCDIFTQLNSKGVRLDVFDLMNALLKPKGLQLKHLWREAKPRVDFVEAEKMNVYILTIMSILRQDYCSPKYLYFLLPGSERPIRESDGIVRKEKLIASVLEFEALWDRAVSAMEEAIRRLRHPQEFGVVSPKYLPYVSILPVFAALQSYLAASPAPLRFGGERKIRQWYWASVFTNRYSESVESTSTRDFLDLKSWIEGGSVEPTSVEEFKLRFRDLDLRREMRSGSSIYNGIFNLLVLAGSRDWITNSIPHPDQLDDHHIVPAFWGDKHLAGGVGHSILNRVPLSADTNRKVIGSQLPNAYLPKLIADNGEAAIRATFATHLISHVAFDVLLRNPFTPTDFDDFISERRRTILDAIESLLIKERLDLPPNLRDLDADVEAVELRLRQRIVNTLDGDIAALPPHVGQKLSESVQRALKKNPALNAERYASLSGQLEYADLRDLEQIMTSKVTWANFEPAFVNKESLAGRFDRLAELRNGLRHSRTVDEVIRKEGEGAVIWFRTMLDR